MTAAPFRAGVLLPAVVAIAMLWACSDESGLTEITQEGGGGDVCDRTSGCGDDPCEGEDCALDCEPPFANCDGNRETGCETNTRFSDDHCGACGAACPEGYRCQSGMCVRSECPVGLANCDGDEETGCEVDLRTDPENCGGCGEVCPTGASCADGACFCPSGELVCDGACVPANVCGGCTSMAGDVGAHCGQCGRLVCDGTEVISCEDPGFNLCGGCGPLPGAPEENCGYCDTGRWFCTSDVELICIGEADPQTDERHCGACGNACTDGRRCEEGTCVCPEDQVTIEASPEDATACVGGPVSFSVEASGDEPAIVWQRSVDAGETWQDLTGEDGFEDSSADTLRRTAVTQEMDGHLFRAVASGSCLSRTSEAAALTVQVCQGGICGPASGRSTATAPDSALCSAGTPTAVDGEGPFTWTCLGSGDEPDVNCSSSRSCEAETATWTVDDQSCGDLLSGRDHGRTASASDEGPPNRGTATFRCEQGTWMEEDGATCSAVIHAACGSAAGGSTSEVPDSDLCASGTPSGVSGEGPFTWTCVGAEGGEDAECSADRSCDRETRSWTVDGLTCSGTVSGREHGRTRNATDSGPPLAGRATFRCQQGEWAQQGGATCAPVVDGACGSADGGSTPNAPTGNLCSAGTPSAVEGSGPFTWTCEGSNQGESASCSSNRSCTAGARNWSVSGNACAGSVTSAQHGQSRTATDDDLPNTGSAQFRCDQGAWTRQPGATCQPVVDGACGEAGGGHFGSAPTSDLCTAGTASAVSGDGPFTWTCGGLNGGDDITCSANRSCAGGEASWTVGDHTCSGSVAARNHGQSRTATDNGPPNTGTATLRCDQGAWVPQSGATCAPGVVGACGSARGRSTLTPPTSNLCSAGTATPVTGDGPWTWTCQGSGAGADAECSSNRSCAGVSMSWTVEGSTCGGEIGNRNHGQSRTATAQGPQTAGSATYRCEQGAWNQQPGATCAPVVSGTCGEAAGNSTLGAPTADLCATGAPSAVSGNGPFAWTCAGSNGGDDASCSSDRSCEGGAASWTVDGSTCSSPVTQGENGHTRPVSDSERPNTGAATLECRQGTWVAQPGATCAPVVDGQCGTADGGNTVNAPSNNLCSDGTPTAVSGGGPFTWTCLGSNGGTDAACASDRRCARETLSWTVDGFTCSASFNARNHGQSRTASDSEPPITGTATFQCNQGTWEEQDGASCASSGFGG